MTEVARDLTIPKDLFSEGGSLDALTFVLRDTRYAIPIAQVRYIEQDPRESSRVDSDDGQHREVTTYLNQVVPIVDFAHLVQLQPAYEENFKLIETLELREQDHVNWLDALEDSILHNTPFTKATDPHQCAFGQWYDKFEPEDELLQDIMADFDAPHKRIHGLATRLLSLAKSDKDQAIEILEKERNFTLAKLMELFDIARDRLRSITRPVLVFVDKSDGALLAIRLDAIEDIETFDISQCAPYDSLSSTTGKHLGIISGYLNNKDNKRAPSILLDWREFNGHP